MKLVFLKKMVWFLNYFSIAAFLYSLEKFSIYWKCVFMCFRKLIVKSHSTKIKTWTILLFSSLKTSWVLTRAVESAHKNATPTPTPGILNFTSPTLTPAPGILNLTTPPHVIKYFWTFKWGAIQLKTCFLWSIHPLLCEIWLRKCKLLNLKFESI